MVGPNRTFSGGATRLVLIWLLKLSFIIYYFSYVFLMMVRLVEPHLNLVTRLLDTLNSSMLIIGPQNLQWRHHMPAEEVSGAKLNTKNCLMK